MYAISVQAEVYLLARLLGRLGLCATYPVPGAAHQVLKMRNSGAGSCFLRHESWFT